MSVVLMIAALLHAISGASGASTMTLAVGIMMLALVEYFKPALAALYRVITHELERAQEQKHVRLQNQISSAVAAAMAAATVPVQAVPVPAVQPAIPAIPGQNGGL